MKIPNKIKKILIIIPIIFSFLGILTFIMTYINLNGFAENFKISYFKSLLVSLFIIFPIASLFVHKVMHIVETNFHI